MKKVSAFLMGIVLLSAVVYTGCKKDATPTTNANTSENDATAAQDEANASFIIQDSKGISDGAAKGQATEKPYHGLTCGTITGDTSATTDTLDIHFSGLCVSPDGRIRKGDIIVYWTRHKGYFDSGASITQTWRNYSVTTLLSGTISVTGSNTYMNTSKDTDGDHSWTYNSSVTLTYSSGGTATWTANRNNVLTKIGTEWYYVITGGATGVSKSGVTYTESITSPLYWTAYGVNLANGGSVCDCFEQGTVEFTLTGKKYPVILSFTSGVGNCNKTATATINGTNYNITLP